MKILFVVHQLNYGGVQKSLISALDVIDYSKHDVTLYIRKKRVQLLPDVNRNVNRIIINEDKTHYYRKPYMVYLMMLEVLSKLSGKSKWREELQRRMVTYINESQMRYEKKNYFAKEEYDVAIAYIQGYTAQFVAKDIKAAKKYMFYHSSTDEKHELHEKIMPCFDKVVAVNEKNAKLLEEWYPVVSERITYIDNYVDARSITKRAGKTNIPRNGREVVLCSCGRLAPEKGFALAVQAAKILKEKKVSFYWYFVGDGIERTNLEQMITENYLGDYIEITGMQDNPYSFIGGCDIYVQPSLEESFGLTIAEAKILGRPVVSTRTVGALGQIVHLKNGILTEISAEKIADGILRYIDDKELQERVVKNLRKIDYIKMFREYQDKWQQLLED